jgi:diadenosine tetraphosphatase ApaH/serine/threonine PP2A family protein phosphatase
MSACAGPLQGCGGQFSGQPLTLVFRGDFCVHNFDHVIVQAVIEQGRIFAGPRFEPVALCVVANDDFAHAAAISALALVIAAR